LVEFPRVAGKYQPSSQLQIFEIPFKLKNIESLNRAVLGGLKVSLLADEAQTTGIKIAASIVATFAYYPLDGVITLNSAISPKLEITGVTFSRLAKDIVPFHLIPNLPFIFNSGPQAATFEVRNSGNIFLNTKTKVVVVDPRFFGSGSDTELLRFVSEPDLLVPNQIRKLDLNLTKPEGATSSSADLFPSFGIYKVITKSTGLLGDEVITSVTKNRWIIIFPWKYTLGLIFLIWILYRWLGVRVKINSSTDETVVPENAAIRDQVVSFNQEFEKLISRNETSKEESNK
jgi:hypothetical protein